MLVRVTVDWALKTPQRLLNTQTSGNSVFISDFKELSIRTLYALDYVL